MHLLGLAGTGFIAAVAGFWAIAVIGLSLVECGGNLGRLLGTWRFVLFERPVQLVREAVDWFRAVFLGPERQRERHATAKDLSDVLQIPIVDAELSLELSEAFFHPTDDPQLNGEAVGLLFASNPRNETWRTQASECCRRLKELSREDAGACKLDQFGRLSG
jgi:hypothetical protein